MNSKKLCEMDIIFIDDIAIKQIQEKIPHCTKKILFGLSITDWNNVVVFDKPISIKTLTKKKLDGIKMTWTNSIERSLHFVTTYIPRCDMLLLHINWNSVGGLYLITKDTQITEMKKLGRDKYFKMPKIGTNAKGVSLSVLALLNLISNPSTKHIPIEWNRIQQEQKNEYAKYAELWK